MLPVTIDAPLRYRRGVGIADATLTYIAWMCPGQLVPLRPRCLELADDCNGVLRLRPHGVVGVDICRPDPSIPVDDRAGRHRQPTVGLGALRCDRRAPQPRRVPACVGNLRGSGVVLRPLQPNTVRILW